MATKKITVVLYPSENGYVAYMPLFPGCTTQGETAEEAFQMAKESLELMLYEPDEFDLWALDAYSDEVVVGTVEIEFPVVPGPDWKFGEEAQIFADELWEEEAAGVADTTED